jgi:hypothetical protein
VLLQEEPTQEQVRNFLPVLVLLLVLAFQQAQQVGHFLLQAIALLQQQALQLQ